MKNILDIKTLIEGNIYVIEKTLKKKKLFMCIWVNFLLKTKSL